MLSDPFDIVFTGDVARRALVDESVCEALLTEYRVFLHECLQTSGVVVAPNGWLIGGGPGEPRIQRVFSEIPGSMLRIAPE